MKSIFKFGLSLIAIFLLSTHFQAKAENNDTIYRVDPPHWWTGMEWNEVELVFYGKNVGKYKLNIQSTEVDLVSTKTYDNPNYAFVTIKIKENAKPGKVQFKFFKGLTKRLYYNYEIKAREENTFKRKGLTAGDLVYLLMPDRFANGNPNNDTIAGMLENNVQRDSLKFRHGGDLQGVVDHMDYFTELGVGALWLNPVFTNDQPKESYHGYAITDHYEIDPRFGSLDEYKSLVKASHDVGIKMVMDIVHNHCGDQHYFIKDLPHEQWIHQWPEYTKTSYRAPTLFDPYASEYDKKKFSDGWFDHHMPDLNQQDEHVRNYLIQNHIWWVEETKIDAYRIDTYAYPDQEFMAEWAEAIQKEFPYLTLFGEAWVHGAATQSWFVENSAKKEFDSKLPGITDFQMYYAFNDALTKKQEWTGGVSKIYYCLAKDYLYDDPMNNVIFLDNHDLDRVYSVVKNDPKKLKMGIALLLTMRGVPQLYYGTEIGLDGTKNPNDGVVRQNFPGGWPGDPVDKFKKENLSVEERDIYDYTRTLANYRKNNSVLQDGKFLHFVPEDDLYTYFRSKSNYRVMVNFNFSDKAKTINTGRFNEMLLNFGSAKNVMTGEVINDLSTLTIPANEALILELIPVPKEQRVIR